MTVRELESEFLLGQKWAVECEKYISVRDPQTNVEISYDEVGTETTHYQTGNPRRCPYFDYTILSLRVVNNEIYIRVKEEVEDTGENIYCKECEKESCVGCDIANYGRPLYFD